MREDTVESGEKLNLPPYMLNFPSGARTIFQILIVDDLIPDWM